MKYQEVIDDINEVMKREIPLLLSLSEEQVNVRRNNGEDARGASHRLCVKQPPAHGAAAVRTSVRTLNAEHRDGYARLPRLHSGQRPLDSSAGLSARGLATACDAIELV